MDLVDFSITSEITKWSEQIVLSEPAILQIDSYWQVSITHIKCTNSMLTVHFLIMVKVQPARRGRIVFFTFQRSSDAKDFITNMKDKEKKMAAAIDEIGKQAQILHAANEQLRAENQELQKMLKDSYEMLAAFMGPEEEEEEEEQQEENQDDIFSQEF